VACSNTEQLNKENPLTLYFDLNIDTLSQEHLIILDFVGKTMQDNPTKKLIIGFYSDEDEKDNIVNKVEISWRRVHLALDYLKLKWNYNPSQTVVEESVLGRTLGQSSIESKIAEKNIETSCRCVYFKFEK
jgi:hypothetical protein